MQVGVKRAFPAGGGRFIFVHGGETRRMAFFRKTTLRGRSGGI